MTRQLKVAIIGLGRVGSVFAGAIRESPHQLVASVGRTASGDPAATLIFPAAIADAALVIIAVPDDAIAEVARQYAPHRPQGQTLAHCSGLLPASILGDPPALSLHPLQTFDGVTTPDLSQQLFTLEGDPAAQALGRELLAAWNAKTISLRAEAKASYHAACVFVSNYGMLLWEAARQLLADSGIDDLTLLLPLWRQSADNACRQGPANALTGPLLRRDWQTLDAHLSALSAAHPQLALLYGELALHLAVQLLGDDFFAGDPSDLDRLKALLDKNLKKISARP